MVWQGQFNISETESIDVDKGLLCVTKDWKRRIYEIGKMISEAVGTRLKEVRKINGGKILTIHDQKFYEVAKSNGKYEVKETKQKPIIQVQRPAIVVE